MKKKLLKLIVLFIGTVGGYCLLLLYPGFLFAYDYEYRNFEVLSDQPLVSDIEFVIDDAICRLERSALYEDTDQFSVYICNKNWRLWLFTRSRNVGGVVNFPLSPNIFIRESNIERNELVPPGGWMYTPKERPLSYYVAHEATHSLQRKMGLLLQLSTPSYIIEGYADYIGKYPDFDYGKYKEMYLNEDRLMNPSNGLYHKYHFYMAYLMDVKGYSFEEVLEKKPEIEQTLKEAIE